MSSEVAIREEAVGLPSLSDGPNPAAAVAYAAQVSTTIASVLDKGNGYEVIQGKKHVTIEGWQSIAAMTGHSVEVEWSRPVEGMPANEKGVQTWEARAIVRDQHGRQVATGESMADPAEKAPWNRANFSVRSMAQTRAMSRAMASRLRYIVQLAGFSGTPAEEMGDVKAPDPLEVARDRFKVLRSVLGADGDERDASIKQALGDDPRRLADDFGFAQVAYALGIYHDAGPDDRSEDDPVEGEVVDGQESLIPEPRQEDV